MVENYQTRKSKKVTRKEEGKRDMDRMKQSHSCSPNFPSHSSL